MIIPGELVNKNNKPGREIQELEKIGEKDKALKQFHEINPKIIDKI